MNNIEYMLIVMFIISFLAIYLEYKFGYPFGRTKIIVFCLIPPFIKRINVYKNKWIGFDKNWRFVFLKELN